MRRTNTPYQQFKDDEEAREARNNSRPKCYDATFDPEKHTIDPETGFEKSLESLSFWADCLEAQIRRAIASNPGSLWAFKKQKFLMGLKAYVEERTKDELGVDEEQIKRANAAFMKTPLAESLRKELRDEPAKRANTDKRLVRDLFCDEEVEEEEEGPRDKGKDHV